MFKKVGFVCCTRNLYKPDLNAGKVYENAPSLAKIFLDDMVWESGSNQVTLQNPDELFETSKVTLTVPPVVISTANQSVSLESLRRPSIVSSRLKRVAKSDELLFAKSTIYFGGVVPGTSMRLAADFPP